MENNISRRNFIKLSAIALTSLTAGRIFGKTAFAAAKPALKEDDATAKALCYHANAGKVDGKKPECAKKAAPDGASQKCSNCMFFASGGPKDGNCQIFPNNTVMAAGWCASWAKKPG